MNATQLSNLQERVAALAKSVAFFETKREELLFRRRSASDSVIVELDERLKLSEDTLKALRRALALTSRELEDAKASRRSA